MYGLRGVRAGEASHPRPSPPTRFRPFGEPAFEVDVAGDAPASSQHVRKLGIDIFSPMLPSRVTFTLIVAQRATLLRRVK